MKKILIAEIGTLHFGNFDLAKQMIKTAKYSGATLAKLQAYRWDRLTTGTMPPAFYKQCQFSLEQCEELIHYGRSEGIEVFYSIFDDSYAPLLNIQKYRKLSGSQTREAVFSGKHIDTPDTFLSFPNDCLFKARDIENAIPLYVTPYLPNDPELWRLEYLDRLRNFWPKAVYPNKLHWGYSCHYPGIDACISAVRQYGAHVIEKHFGLQKNVKYDGAVFRDSIHCATPDEFEFLANIMEE